MKDFSFREVLGLMSKTAPFLVFRFLIYFGITLGVVLITGAGAGIGYGIGLVGDNAPAVRNGQALSASCGSFYT